MVKSLNRLTRIIILLIVPLVLLSCAGVIRLPLEIKRPASFSVPPDILSIVVADHAFPFRSDSMHVVMLPHDTILVDTIMVDDFSIRVATALVNELENRAFFDSASLHPVSLNTPPTGAKLKIAPSQTISYLSERHDVQAIAAIENAEYSSEIKIGFHEGHYYVTLDATGELFWKLYDSNGLLLDVYLQRDTIFWHDVIPMYSDQEREIPAIRDAIEMLATFMGENYANRLSPRWETATRSLFTKGHYLFDRATELVEANDWEEAAKIWFHLYSTGNNALHKAKASHNLALSFEVRGNFDEAIAWSDKSLEYFNQVSPSRASNRIKSLSRLYNIELKKRRNEGFMLQQQTGIGF